MNVHAESNCFFLPRIKVYYKLTEKMLRSQGVKHKSEQEYVDNATDCLVSFDLVIRLVQRLVFDVQHDLNLVDH